MEHFANAEWQKLNLSRLAVAVGATSLFENAIYHPWWVLKTREQVEASYSKNVWINSYRLATNIWKKEGVRSLYRGFWPGTLGSLPSGYVYLITYHKYKHDISQSTSSALIRSAAPFLAGVIAEAASLGLFVPVDVVTQRMQLQNTAGQNCFQVGRDIARSEGLPGFYRGTSLTAIKLGIASGIWWLAYERTKRAISTFPSTPATATTGDGNSASVGILPGLVAGVLSTLVTNPLDVVKTRIQTQVHLDGQPNGVPYRNMMEGFKSVWVQEGWAGLNRGLIPKLVSQGPMSAIWGVIYEFILSYSVIKEVEERCSRHDSPNDIRAF